MARWQLTSDDKCFLATGRLITANVHAAISCNLWGIIADHTNIFDKKPLFPLLSTVQHFLSSAAGLAKSRLPARMGEYIVTGALHRGLC